jgi:hypothetical protein
MPKLGEEFVPCVSLGRGDQLGKPMRAQAPPVSAAPPVTVEELTRAGQTKWTGI